MSEVEQTSTTNTEVAPEPSTILGGGGQPEPTGDFDPTTLPGELANEPSLRNFDSIEKLAKSYVHAVRKLGAPGEELVRINGETDKEKSITGWAGLNLQTDTALMVRHRITLRKPHTILD